MKKNEFANENHGIEAIGADKKINVNPYVVHCDSLWLKWMIIIWRFVDQLFDELLGTFVKLQEPMFHTPLN